jgi:hypothetical protein
MRSDTSAAVHSMSEEDLEAHLKGVADTDLIALY